MEITEPTHLPPEAIETVPSVPVSSTNEDGPEIITGMNPELYSAAFKGESKAFEQVRDINLLLTPTKNTVLHVHFTAETESVSKKEFIEFVNHRCPSLVLKANSQGETPLHIAARYGHWVAAEMLIKHAATLSEDLESRINAKEKLMRATNQVGDSVLHEAVRYNHIEVVELLTKEDAGHSYSANKDGETPLYIAAERGYGRVVSEILNNCKAPAYDGPDGRTALHAAVILGDAEMVEKLLKKENLKPSIRKADDLGLVPLHLAAKWLRSEKPDETQRLLELLLQQDRNTAYIKDQMGRTAFHLAADVDNINTMKLIISKCPDCAEIVDNSGRNALHYAISRKYYSGAKLILEEKSLSNLCNQKDKWGNTPVHILASSSLKQHEYIQVIELLKDQRLDKLAFNNENCTAYEIACMEDDRYQVKGILSEYHVSRMTIQRIKKTVKKKDGDDDPLVKRAIDSDLVVATLITTVTFAAGFTLPGGTIQEGKHQGTPILKHNAAFQAFLVSDTIAMVFSATAVLIHLFLGVSKGQLPERKLLVVAFFLNMVAMASMMIAFVTGTFAMLGASSGLGIVVILIGLLFFIPCYYYSRAISLE